MKRLLLIPILLLAGRCVLAQNATPHPDWSPQIIVAFANVNVIPMDTERVLANQTVLVRDGRIVEIGAPAQVQVPAGALLIDATGKYLLPGMAEMHGHIPSGDTPAQQIEDVLFLYVANGVTTVRGMQGSEGQLEWRARAAQGSIIAPALYLAGPGFSGGSITSPEQAAERVRRQAAEGWDLLKVLPGVTREEYDAMAGAAHEVGIRFAGHVPSDVGLLHAIRRGQQTLDHIDGYVEYLDPGPGGFDASRLADIVRLTREAGVAVVPTMPLWEVILGSADLDRLRELPELQYMPPATVSQWISSYQNRISGANFDLEAAQRTAESRVHLLRALKDGGVTMLFGTDSPQQFSVPGFSVHHEFVSMLDAGFTPYEILVSGTRNVGEHFQGKDSFGTVAVGQRADLVLVDANPLTNIHNFHQIAGVMVRGRWLPKDRIDARLAQIAASNRQ